jgi:hypothetical protein
MKTRFLKFSMSATAENADGARFTAANLLSVPLQIATKGFDEQLCSTYVSD